jgi:hypothetical protein
MKKFLISLAVMSCVFAPPAMAETEAHKTHKNTGKCADKCKVLFGNTLVQVLFGTTPASEATCVEMCMQNPSALTSHLPVDQMKYHVLDTYLWGKAHGNPQNFATRWNAFKAWMDNTYLNQCTNLKVINRDFVSKVKSSYKSKKGKIKCFNKMLQNVNKALGTVGIVR